MVFTAALFLTCGLGLRVAERPPELNDSRAQVVTWPAVKSPVVRDPRIEGRIATLLGHLTLEQKVAQMVQADIRYITPDEVHKYGIGSILNGGGAFPGNNKHAAVADWVALADQFYEASASLPVLWGTDAVHGHNNVVGATLFPHNIGLGATHDPDLIQRIGEVTASEVAATGIDWTFAPTVAVVKDVRWGRSYEGYSERPDIVREYAGRMVRGLQGAPGSSSFLDNNHIIATAKHYIGDGGTERGIDHGDNLSSEQELLDIHAQGYIAALQAGVQTVMASYNSWQGLKVHGQHYLITEVLKNRLGFDGMVVSDWNAIDEVQGCTVDKCAQAVNAGIDLFMVPQAWKAFIENTVAQVRAGDIPETRIDDAVSRILRVKLRAGLFEKGRPSARPLANNASLIGSPEHRAVARAAVRESLVLLKNEGNLLPLRRKSNVLVAGDGADNLGKQAGGWSLTWQGTQNNNSEFPGATSIFEGIRAAVSAGGGAASLSPDGSYSVRPDVAIVVFGENPYAEWHGDLKSLDYRGPNGSSPPDPARPWPEVPMPGQEFGKPMPPQATASHGAESGTNPYLTLVQHLRSHGIPVVAVFLTGRPRVVTPELQASNAFVVAWLPGTEGGGIADVLFRDVKGAVKFDFRGKLAYTWPAAEVPAASSAWRAGGTTSAAANIGDQPAPLFPYGFGLSYCNRHCDTPLSQQSWPTQPSSTSQNMRASPLKRSRGLSTM